MLSFKTKKLDIKSLIFYIFIPVLLTTLSGYAQENKASGKKSKPEITVATKAIPTTKPEVKNLETKSSTKPKAQEASPKKDTKNKKQVAKKDEKKTSSQEKKPVKQDKKTKREKIKQDKQAKREKAKQEKQAKKAKKEAAGKKHKAFRDLNYEDLKVAKARLIKEGKKDVVIKHIEKMIPLCDNIQELRDLSLEISDLLFDEGELKKAETLYSNFCQSYPGDKNIEYANYRAILCNYWLTLDKERDQSLTKNTITLAKSFLERSEIFKQYTQDVQNILADCQNKLLESEICVFKEYLNLGDQLSAKTRLACIEKEFLDQIPNLEPKLLALNCEYAQVFNDQNLLVAKQKELNTKFPDWKDEPVILANNKNIGKIGKVTGKKSFMERF